MFLPYRQSNFELLQNPADPDATFRAKAGKDYLGKQPISEEEPILVTDGGYGRQDKCAAGHEPISQSYTKTTRQCRASFDRNHCAGWPYLDQCRPKIYKK